MCRAGGSCCRRHRRHLQSQENEVIQGSSPAGECVRLRGSPTGGLVKIRTFTSHGRRARAEEEKGGKFTFLPKSRGRQEKKCPRATDTGFGGQWRRRRKATTESEGRPRRANKFSWFSEKIAEKRRARPRENPAAEEKGTFCAPGSGPPLAPPGCQGKRGAPNKSEYSGTPFFGRAGARGSRAC